MRENAGEGLQPPYLLKALHQCACAFDLVHLPCPVQGLFDDVAEVTVVLQGRYDSSERYRLHVCHMASRLGMQACGILKAHYP